jgi:RimJ/RimL family protein N-acetyltransferase
VDPGDVHLERGSGTRGRGSGPGEAYWHILVNGTSAGNVFINVIDEAPIGLHASIHIKINIAWQGRGVAKQAYLLASKASQHDTIYAHMSKSNIASRVAAEHADYTVVNDIEVPQLLMVWNRPDTQERSGRDSGGTDA